MTRPERPDQLRDTGCGAATIHARRRQRPSSPGGDRRRRRLSTLRCNWMFGVNISVPRTQLGHMRAQPLRESFARNFTGGESEHEALLIVNRGAKLHAVHDEEHFHGSMGQVTKAWPTATLWEDAPVKRKDLAKSQIPHVAKRR
jgi:hypothetical protein